MIVIVMIILAAMGLCGGISMKGLCIGILICSGIYILSDITKVVCETIKKTREQSK